MARRFPRCAQGRKRYALLIAVAAVLGASPYVAADTWDGGANNGGAWSSNNNWADNTEPTSADAAIFPTPIPNADSTIALSTGEQADRLVFHDSYTLSGGDITLFTLGLITVDGNKTATITSSVNGSGGLTMQGEIGVGTLVLNPTGSNGFSGPIQITGTVSINKDSALGNAANTVLLGPGSSLGTLQVTGIFSTSRVITPGTQGGTISVDANRIFTMNGALAPNANPFTFNGSGTLNLTAASSRSGSTTIQNGTVTLINLAGLGSGAITVGSSGLSGMLDIAGGTINNSLSLQNTGTIRGNSSCSYTGTITAASFAPNLTLSTGGSSDGLILSSYTGGSASTTHVTGTGAVILSGSGNSYAGAWQIDSGTLRVMSPGTSGSGTSPVVVNNTGTLALQGVTFDRAVTLNNGSTLAFESGGQSNGVHTIDAFAGVALTLKGASNEILGNAPNDLTGGSGSSANIQVISDTAGNVLNLNFANNYAGSWSINNLVTVRITAPGALGGGTDSVLIAAGGVLEVGGVSLARNIAMRNNSTLRGTGTASVTGTVAYNNPPFNSGTAILATSSASDVLTIGDGPNDYTGSGSGGFIPATNVTGPGTIVLPFSNDYGGNWSISSGTLRIGNSSALGTLTSAIGIGVGVDPAALELTNITLNRDAAIFTNATLRGTGAAARYNGTLTVGAGQLVSIATGTLISDVFTLGNGANDLTGGTGSSTITVAGSGKVVLTQFSDYSGKWTISSPATLEADLDAFGAPTTGVTILTNGTLSTTASFSSSRTFTAEGGTFLTAPSTTLTLTAPLGSGTGSFAKQGSGTLSVTGSSSRTGFTFINAGTVRMTGSAQPLGTGRAVVNTGGTLELAGASISNGGITLADGATLKGTGTSSYIQSGDPKIINGPANVSIILPAASDKLTLSSAIRSVSASASSTTLHVSGAGTLVLATGGTSGSDIFGGSWEQSGGILQVGQSDTNSINALGFKNGEARQANTITVNGGTLAVGVLGFDPSFLRANVILAGGNIASTNGITGQYGGDFTTTAGTTSKVLVFDPVSTSTVRHVLLAGGDPILPSYLGAATTWGANSTLIVDPGTTTGGQFGIARDGGTITVGSNATLQINPGATVNLGGQADALSDGVNHVNVVNDSTTTFRVTNGSKNVGGISGVGNTLVDSGCTLTARHIRQGSLTISNTGRVNIRPDSTAAGVSRVNTINLDTTGTFNLNDNKLIVQSGGPGSWNGSSYTGLTGAIVSGKGSSNTWAGSGIITSQSQAIGSNFTTIGIAQASDIRPATATATATWAGQTITGTDTLVMYTYGGDATLDGKINIDDYVRIDSGIAGGYTDWSNGDFNYDGKVNIDDYTTVIDANIGNQNGFVFPTAGGIDGVAAIPEPGGGVLAGIAVLAVARRRGRRRG